MKTNKLRNGRVVTVDSVHLKVQEKHYYDMMICFMEITNEGLFD